jgi:hypothetical protein
MKKWSIEMLRDDNLEVFNMKETYDTFSHMDKDSKLCTTFS